MSKSDIEGKTALVTGASKGIGRAISLALADLGVKVAVNYNSSEAEAKEVAEQIDHAGGESLIVHADVSNAEAVTAMVDKVNEAWGQVDILVNNAGIIGDSLLLRMSDAAWFAASSAAERLRRKLSATSAPCRASSSAMARPMPRVPPVMKAFCPLRSIIG